MIVVVNIWTIAFFLSNLLQCLPISVNWTDWGASFDQCVDTNAIILAQAWSDVITDGNGLPMFSESGFLIMPSSPDPLRALTMCTLLCCRPRSSLIINDLADLAPSHADVAEICCL